MKRWYILLIITFCFIRPAVVAAENDGTASGKTFGLSPITNEVSFYKNVDDDGTDRGVTLQVVAINGITLGTDFIFEFTGDFNWEMSDENHDYYLELSLVKPVWDRFSVNYQRIYATFEDRAINQFGVRVSF